MPNIAISIPETHESITRPVCFDVIRSLLKTTGLPSLTNIQFPGEDKQVQLPGTTIDNPKDSIKFGQGERLLVEVSEEYQEQYFLTSAVKRQENVLIFSDPTLGVAMKPVYTPTLVTLTLTYRAKDKVDAERWRDEIKMRTSMGREGLLHELRYHYPIPREYLVILNHLHELKENVAPYGETLKDWFMRCFVNRVTTKVTQAGTRPLLAINEVQVGVLGHFDFTGVPENAAREGENANWSINFSYSFVYDKVTSCVLSYPLLVHNQLIDRKFRDTSVPYDFEKKFNHRSLSRYSFDTVRKADVFRSPVAGYSIPYWDEWLPKVVPPFTTTMLKIMLQIDPENPTGILNFKELGKYQIKAPILEFLEAESKWLTLPGESVFLTTLFRRDIPLEPSYLEVDSDLTVRASAPLDLRTHYHLRLAVVNDLFTLSKAAEERLRRNGLVCITVFKALFEELGVRGELPKPIGKGYIPRREFIRAAQLIKDTSRPHHTGIEINRLTVGQFIVVADNERE